MANLDAQLADAASPKEQVEILNNKAWSLRHYNLWRATELASQALRIATEAQDQAGISHSLYHMAIFNNRLNNHQQALIAAQEALHHSGKHSPQRIEALTALGLVHWRLGSLSDAIDYLMRALLLAEAIDSTALQQLMAHNGLALIYVKIGNHQLARSLYLKIADLVDQLDDPGLRSMYHSNVCGVEFALGNLDSAQAHGERSLKISREADQPRASTYVMRHLGRIHTARGNYEEAAEIFANAMELARISQSAEVLISLLMSTGDMHTAQGAHERALNTYLQALTEAENAGVSTQLSDCYQRIAACYEQQGNYQHAYEYQKHYSTISQEIRQANVQQRLDALPVLDQSGLSTMEAETLRRESQSEKKRQRLSMALQKEHELNEMKKRFMLTVSHQFRTPLTIIQNAAYLLERHFDRIPEEKRFDYIRDIRAQSEWLAEMLDDILVVAEHTYGHLKIQGQSTDFTKSLQNIVQTLTLKYDAADRIRLHLPNEVIDMTVDLHKMRNVIGELVTNALKFSDGPVDLTVTMIPDGIQCTVQDSGFGIPEAEQTHIFEPFFRGSGAENIRGTGLGLAVAKDYIEMHNAEISFTSEPGNTIFTVTFYQDA